MGFSLNEALWWAGFAEYYDGDTRPAADGSPWGGYPYGESPETIFWIRMGWWYYWHNLHPPGESAPPRAPLHPWIPNPGLKFPKLADPKGKTNRI